MKDIKYSNFIGLYDEVFPDGFCHSMIEEFERLSNNGMVRNRRQSEGASKTRKDDQFLFINAKDHYTLNFNGESCIHIFMDGLQKCFRDYVQEYDILDNVEISGSIMKVQKTNPGGGYHVWHFEQDCPMNANRIMTYMVYLNNLDENGAGETEFLYQQLRIPPKENAMIIWPASYTHTHRGNVVHGNTPKYVITGWFNLG